MFDRFLRRQPPRVIDTDLGPLTLEHGYWSGEYEFTPGGTRVSLFIDDAAVSPRPIG
jgi:hypothetical protein